MKFTFPKIIHRRREEEKAAEIDTSGGRILLTSGGGYFYNQKNRYELIREYKSWVYSAIQITANNIGAFAVNSLRLYRGDKVVETHYILDLLNKVNPYMNRYDLFEETAIHLELVGVAYWYLLGDRLPLEIYPLSPDGVYEKPGKEKIIDHYDIWQNGRVEQVPPDKIIRFAYTNPLTLRDGYSPLQGASYEYDVLKSVNEYEKHLFENYGQLGGIITGAKNIDEAKRLAQMWKEQHRGTKSAGMPAFLTGGMDYKEPPSPKDLTLDETKKNIRNEVLGIMRVPPSKLGQTEKVNRANAEANDYTFVKDKIFPLLMKIQSKLNERFTPMFGSDLELKFENIIPTDKTFTMLKNTNYVKAGIYKINEVREEEGKPPVPWGDDDPRPNMMGLGKEDVQHKNINVITKGDLFEKRTILWNKFLIKHRNTEIKLYKKVSEQFRKQERKIIKELFKLKEGKSFKIKEGEIPIDELLSYLLNTSLYDTEAWEELFNYVLHPDMASWIMSTGERFGVSLDIGFTDPAVSGYLKTHIPKVVGDITDTTRKNIEQQIRKGYENGESIEMMANRIRSVFNIATTSRARTIARTETTGASNYGILKGFEGADVEKKIWITARDELVRTAPFDHMAAEGETVHRQDYFTATGEPLSIPGDSNGSPGNIINCRCTMDGE